MSESSRKRKLSNVRLTRQHHYRYLGLWLFLFVVLIGTLNGLLLAYAEQRWAGVYAWDDSLHNVYLEHRVTFLGAMVVEIVLFVAGAIMLAQFTSHRIAGPYLRLVKAMNAVRDGDFEQRLKFRSYDRLEYVESAFNEMMESIAERCHRQDR